MGSAPDVEATDNLNQRRAEVLARAEVAITQTLWQHRGQPLEGTEALRIEAGVAAAVALGVFAESAELWAECAESLAAAAAANERYREEVLATRRPARP